MASTHTTKEHMKPSPLERKPSTRQLSYIKQLALSAGRSFTYPKTAREASKLIEELKRSKAATSTQDRDWEGLSARRDREHIAARDTQERPRDASRFREDEIAGYGSSAAYTDPWAGHHTED